MRTTTSIFVSLLLVIFFAASGTAQAGGHHRYPSQHHRVVLRVGVAPSYGYTPRATCRRPYAIPQQYGCQQQPYYGGSQYPSAGYGGGYGYNQPAGYGQQSGYGRSSRESEAFQKGIRDQSSEEATRRANDAYWAGREAVKNGGRRY